jgi:hypothetical protein
VKWSLPSFTKSAELHVLPALLSPELTQDIIKQLPCAAFRVRVLTDHLLIFNNSRYI